MQSLSIALLIFSLVLGTTLATVRIGSFNLHQYGAKKSANATLTRRVAEIINDFDLAIIQEITDVSLTAPGVLFQALNSVSTEYPYTMTISPRVGRSATKEQYIFFNRQATSGLEVVNAYIYDDSVADRFERPPHIGTFKVKEPKKSNVKLFTIMNVHLRPDKAYEELLAMRYVIRDFIIDNPQYFDQTDSSFDEALAQNVINATLENKPNLKTNHPILIVGDFNADCSYISPRRQELLRTINYADFTWVITGDMKTNTRRTCAYDRVFINGDSFVDAIVPDSPGVVNFQEQFGMTLEEALKVSDHMPVKFDIEW